MSTEKNRAITERVFKGLASGDLAAAQGVLTAKMRKGGESSAKLAKTVFPDLRLKLEDTIAEGDKVVVRWTATGTHKGKGRHAMFGSVEPTGKELHVSGMTILRFKDGEVVETWGLTDELGAAAQLGVVGKRG
jgi:predicted ester cyclase